MTHLSHTFSFDDLNNLVMITNYKAPSYVVFSALLWRRKLDYLFFIDLFILLFINSSFIDTFICQGKPVNY